MRIARSWSTGIILIAALCLYASGQSTPSPPSPQNPPGKGIASQRSEGVPPRATPADYQAHAPAGTVTVAAEFLGHSVPTPQGTFNTEDYVAVEAALFGPPEARLKMSFDDFSVRINEKKMPVPSQPFGAIFRSLKDPEWAPPDEGEAKSKTSLSTGGQGKNDSPPAPVHMPIELQRAMEQHVQKVALPEGDRALPQAGLIFFPYRGKGTGIHSIELNYAGPAGKATLMLQP
jgi:hypothetical protein